MYAIKNLGQSVKDILPLGRQIEILEKAIKDEQAKDTGYRQFLVTWWYGEIRTLKLRLADTLEDELSGTFEEANRAG